MLINYSLNTHNRASDIARELGFSREYIIGRDFQNVSDISGTSYLLPRMYVYAGTREECLSFDKALLGRMESHVTRNVHNGNLGKSLLSKSNFFSTKYLIINQVVYARSGDPVVDRFYGCRSKNDVDLRSALSFKIAGLTADLSRFMGMKSVGIDTEENSIDSPYLDSREPSAPEKAFIKAATLSLFDEDVNAGDGIVNRTLILSAPPNSWMTLTQSKRMSLLMNELLFIQLLTKER